MKKYFYISYSILHFTLISCATDKALIGVIPVEDQNTTVYYCNDEISFTLNGSLLYEANSFGRSSGGQTGGELITGSTASFFTFPLGRYDKSFALLPSISHEGKYLIKTDDQFKWIQIRFNRDVDINIVNLIGKDEKNLTITIPDLEYSAENYQIPWSQQDDIFFAMKGDSLFKFFPDLTTECLLTKEYLYDFSVSPSENYALVFADDSLFLYDLKKNIKEPIFEVGRVMGINPMYVRAINWLEDDSKFTFAIGSTVYIYSLSDGIISEDDMGDKVFDVMWINDSSFLCVIGDYPPDLAHMKFIPYYKILNVSMLDGSSEIIHNQLNHEPFKIKPKLSPSKKLFIFSERPTNGPYKVKIMSLDGKSEKVIAEGFLPFWGPKQK
jgi:hypothetical protein